jgi:NADH-quinone oxidoreductase subunit F
MSESVDISVVDALVEELGGDAEQLIPLLQGIQRAFRYLPDEALKRVCQLTEIPPAQVEGVATFYAQFRRSPMGEHVVRVCDGTACHVKGSEAVFKSLLRELEIEAGDTDSAGRFTVLKVACLGCCTLAPAVQIDEVTYGHVKPDAAGDMLRDFLENEAAQQARKKGLRAGISMGEIRVGLISCCVAAGSAKVRDAVEEAVAKLGCTVDIKPVGCVGMCHQTPMLEVVIPGEEPVLYAKVNPADVAEIVARHFWSDNPFIKVRQSVEGFLKQLACGEVRALPERYELNVRDKAVADYLGRQQHLATQHFGVLNPADLKEYRGLGGFVALREALSGSDPEAVLELIDASGLRGRGGGGFPTGRKWMLVRQAAGEKKYLICNGDEGDPGAFMDRMILESDPFRVIEGMLIASYAVGASEGILYVRSEYPLAVRRMREAIAACEEAGLLGSAVMGSDHAFTLRVFEGAGAFVCGEESALIESLEGRRGMPHYRPPFPAERGFRGQPTLVNNAETFSLVPWIVHHGAAAFAAYGTEKSRGTKVFSLAGKVARGGLIEVPMGMTIREVVEGIGGGVANGRRFKAVQIGGPSGGCIPASMGDLTVDFEALTEAGAMMGSGGFVVLDDRDCMVEIARYFLSFTQNESCGKCTPCRVGTTRMLEILTRFCKGTAVRSDLTALEQLARTVRSQSLCGLGKTAPNPVLTALAYFRDEFEAHLEGRCPAGTCSALIRYSIDTSCIGCTKCVQGCPVDAISGEAYTRLKIDTELCVRCDNCRQICPADAVVVS